MIAEKQKSLPALMKEADDLISLFVRKNAADAHGMVECISCGCRIHYTKADCAHLVPRRHSATRYLLENLAPACKECNQFNPDEHVKKWIEKIGQAKYEELWMKAQVFTKWMPFEYIETIAMLKRMLKILDGK